MSRTIADNSQKNILQVIEFLPLFVIATGVTAFFVLNRFVPRTMKVICGGR
jgi:hypothetical protein